MDVDAVFVAVRPRNATSAGENVIAPIAVRGAFRDGLSTEVNVFCRIRRRLFLYPLSIRVVGRIEVVQS